ncbi:IS3 family transposase [Paenibacillus sp. L3-i20]|uniref:IS3 family transposase n=1 Tax=Paenibacillus sp. L3-i20 TaxID=2905833 RepID=UPI0035CD12A3
MLRDSIENDIEYYNTDRNQWTLIKMTPAEHRNHLLSATIQGLSFKNLYLKP